VLNVLLQLANKKWDSKKKLLVIVSRQSDSLVSGYKVTKDDGYKSFSTYKIGYNSNATLYAFHSALSMVTLTISPCTNVTLTLGWITLFMGDMGEEALHREDEVTVKQRN
jgi:hypothetical protein